MPLISLQPYILYSEAVITASAIEGYDPYFDYVAALLHFDGASGSTSTTEQLGATATVYGSATLTAESKKFGTTSLAGAASSGVAVTPYSTTTNPTTYSTEGKDFTLEAWIKISNYPAASYGAIAGTWRWSTGHRGGYFFHISSTGQLMFQINGTTSLTTTSVIPLNEWTHVAINRTGTTYTLYINGFASATLTSAQTSGAIDATGTNGTWDKAGDLHVGYVPSDGAMAYGFPGYIDDVRLTIGVGRYPANFNPLPVAHPDKFGIADVDPYADAVKLLVHFDGDNNGTTFTDVKGHTITRVGNPVLTNTTSKFGTTSLYCPTGTDYAQVAASSDFVFPGDFTIECWVWGQNPTNYGEIIGNYTGNFSDHWAIEVGGNGIISWYSSGGTSTNQLVSNTAWNINQWNHVAAVRSGTTCTLYLNGAAVASKTVSGTLGSASTTTYIGGRTNNPGTSSLRIDEVRITNNFARYTAAFKPRSFAFADSTLNGGALDVYAKQVKLLLQMEGTNGGSTFTDEAGHVFTAQGGATTSNTRAKFGSTALTLDGSTGYITTPNNADLTVGNGDFTIEMWVWQVANNTGYAGTYQTIFGQYQLGTGSNASIWLGTNSGNLLGAVIIGGSQLNCTGPLLTLGQWNHIAFVRKDSLFTLYVNGISSGTATSTGAVDVSTRVVAIGADSIGQGIWNGTIDAFRLTRGVARYISNFTPPTAAPLSIATPYNDYAARYGTDPLAARTVLQLGFDTFDPIDSTTNISLTQNRSVSPSMSNFVQGGAGNFSGVNYVTGSSPGVAFGTGDFTIEAWVNIPSYSFTGNIGLIFFTGTSGNGNIALYINASGKLVASTFSTIIATSTPSVPTNRWVHVAVTRRNSVVLLFINGEQVGGNNATYNMTEQNIWVGGNASYGFIGLIDNLRVSNVCRYTERFVPSTDGTVNYAGDPYFSNVSLLCHFDGAHAGTTFTEVTGKALTKISNPQTSTTVTKYGHSVLVLNGLSAFTLADHADFQMGYGDFTVEMWVQPTANAGADTRLWSYQNTGSSTVMMVGRNSSGQFFGELRSSTGTQNVRISGSTITSLNVWYHVAFVRSNGTTYLFVNGVQEATATGQNQYLSVGNPSIGYFANGNNSFFTGYIDELRVTKGVARYVNTFYPHGSAFANGGGTYTIANDPFINNVTLQMHMNDANFTDVKGHTVTVSSAGGTVTNNTATKKFGAGSMQLDGNTSLVTVTSSPDFTFGMDDFTEEAWIYPTAAPASQCAIWSNSPNTGTQHANTTLGLSMLNSRVLRVQSAYTIFITGTTALALNQWHHVAISRVGPTMYLFVNGNLEASAASSHNFSDVLDFKIGGYLTVADGQHFTGLIDDLRITKGIGRYSSAFTPSTLANPDV